jgi:hypothetical protein
MGQIIIVAILLTIAIIVSIFKNFELSDTAKVIDDFKIKAKFLSEKFKSLEKSPILISDLKKDNFYSQLVDLLLELEKTNKGLIKKLESTSWSSKNLEVAEILHPELKNVNGKKEIDPKSNWEVKMSISYVKPKIVFSMSDNDLENNKEYLSFHKKSTIKKDS